MGYKPSVFEHAKFDYSPFGNIFTKGLDKEDKKEALFKRLENIKDENEELLNAFSAVNKVSETAKNKNDFHYDSRYNFYRFDRDFKDFKRKFFKNYKPLTTETKIIKIELLKISINFKINTSILTKKLR